MESIQCPIISPALLLSASFGLCWASKWILHQTILIQQSARRRQKRNGNEYSDLSELLFITRQSSSDNFNWLFFPAVAHFSNYFSNCIVFPYAFAFNLFANLFTSKVRQKQIDLVNLSWNTSSILLPFLRMFEFLWQKKAPSDCYFELFYVCAVVPLCSSCYMLLFSLLTHKFYYLCSFSSKSVKKLLIKMAISFIAHSIQRFSGQCCFTSFFASVIVFYHF